MKRILSLSAMVSTIILSFLLDRGFTLLSQAVKDKFGADYLISDRLRPLLIGEMVANIIFILTLLGLAWLVLLRFNKDVLIAWIFILVGFIILRGGNHPASAGGGSRAPLLKWVYATRNQPQPPQRLCNQLPVVLQDIV